MASCFARSSAKVMSLPMSTPSLNFDAAVGEALHAALDDFLLQLEVRDAVDQQAAGAVVAVIDGDLVAERRAVRRRPRGRRGLRR